MAITVAMRTEVSQLYVALFGRAPDADGLGFWTQRVDAGESMTQIANEMYGTDPARAYYPLFLTNQEIIASFYLNVLGRPADAEGLAYWTAQLNATGATPGSVIATMINVVANYVALGGTDPAGLTSAALFNNKVAVAQYYGEHSGNIADATVVLAGVTADPTTVTAVEAQIASGAIGQSGITAALTTGADLVNGTTAGDTVNGVFGTAANATYNAGDVIDLGDGSTDTLNLVANGVTASDAVIVKNVEIINITDTQGATFDATLVQNNPGINFLSTQAGKTSTVTNAALADVIGLAGAGNLTVGYASPSGKASISLAGTGTSAKVPSTIDLATLNSSKVTGVNIAATGTNFDKIVAGSLASTITVTGNGTNSFDLSASNAMAALGTIDASASTGANTFALGGNLSSGTTIKGGTGTDAVSGTFNAASLVVPTMTGVEKFSATWNAGAVLDLGSATGLTSLTVSSTPDTTTGNEANIKVQNASSSVATVTDLGPAPIASDGVTMGTAHSLSFGYAAATKGDLTLDISSTSSSATAFDIAGITLKNTNSVMIASLDANAHDTGAISISGHQTSLGFSVAAGGTLTTGETTITGAVDHLTETVGAGGYYSGGVILTAGHDLGNVDITVADGGTTENWIQVSGGNVGNITTTVTGNGGYTGEYTYIEQGNAGDITTSITGNGNDGWIGVTASGAVSVGASFGSIGNISLSITGDSNSYTMDLSGGRDYDNGHEIATGTMGDITANITGDNNTWAINTTMSGGDIGNVTVTQAGDGNSGFVNINAMSTYSYDTAYHYVGGGNVGNINLTVDGASSIYVSGGSSGGSMGDVTVSMTNGAWGRMYVGVAAQGWYSGFNEHGGDIGNVSISVGAASSFSGHFKADGGNIGTVTIDVNGAGASGRAEFTAIGMSGGYGTGLDSNDYDKGGSIGDITLNINGAGAHYSVGAYASGGNIGNVNVSVAGTGASGYMYLRSQTYLSGSPGGNVGTVDVTLADKTSFGIYANFDQTMDAVTVNAGSNTHFEMYVSGGWNYFGTDDALLTSVNITMANSATSYLEVGNWGGTGHFSGSVGAITANYGTGASAGFYFDVDGSVGAISVTEGAGSSVNVAYSGGAIASAGKVTLAGGDSASSAGVWSLQAMGSHGGVDASAWAGHLYVDLSGVALGTTIKVGTGGSNITGTAGADNIFLGSGKDTVHFNAPAAVDTLFNFTVGSGKDVLDLANTDGSRTLGVVHTTNTAEVATADEVVRLVDIAGGQDITTAAGLTTALAASGEYAAITSAANAHLEIVTASASTASTLYVFDAADSNGDGVIDAVTLVGVVNTTAASAISNLNVANFA